MRIWCLCALLLVGCAGNKTIDYHPPEPETVKPVNVQWKVNDGQVWLSWGDFQKLGLWMRDVERYVKEQRAIIDYYRNEKAP